MDLARNTDDNKNKIIKKRQCENSVRTRTRFGNAYARD